MTYDRAWAQILPRLYGRRRRGNSPGIETVRGKDGSVVQRVNLYGSDPQRGGYTEEGTRAALIRDLERQKAARRGQ